MTPRNIQCSLQLILAQADFTVVNGYFHLTKGFVRVVQYVNFFPFEVYTFLILDALFL